MEKKLLPNYRHMAEIRYENDPTYKNLVDAIYKLFDDGNADPTDFGEAYNLAHDRYQEACIKEMNDALRGS